MSSTEEVWRGPKRATSGKFARGRPGETTVFDRFEEKYIPEPNSGCWLWLGSQDKNGYAVLYDFRRNYSVRASHVVLEMVGRPRQRRLYALHTCDNPPCVNPEHLYWGTQTDNNNDSIRRGRWGERKPTPRRGEYHYLAKLTDSAVREIRLSLAAGLSQRRIAEMWGVSRGTICDIARGIAWRHVD